jgi:hypothetical protein
MSLTFMPFGGLLEHSASSLSTRLWLVMLAGRENWWFVEVASVRVRELMRLVCNKKTVRKTMRRQQEDNGKIEGYEVLYNFSNKFGKLSPTGKLCGYQLRGVSDSDSVTVGL